MKKYPIGIQSLSEIITGGYFYVDKTPFVKRLAEEGKFYFLSRPRRFGKTLFLDTLAQAYLGRADLFKGLFLEHSWDWSKSSPVLKFSWGAGVLRSPEEVREKFEFALTQWSREFSNDLLTNCAQRDQFIDLVKGLHRRTGKKVVILIDEYDKPILDNITRPLVAVEMREELKNIYSVVKDCDEHIELAFITGVSKFSKVSLFSGLNNLKDISQAPGFGSICGYTQEDLETVFAPSLEGVDLAEVKRWYNGYRFGDEQGVYNPFDLLLFLDSREFRNYWFESATPTFLIDMLSSRKFAVPNLERIQATDEILGSFDIEKLSLTTLLFQAGYLTIGETRRLGSSFEYDLKFPNLEVKMSMANHILTHLVDGMEEKTAGQRALWNAMLACDLAAMQEVFQGFFESIPFEWYTKNRLAEYEGYYASIFYCYFTALGLDTRPEESVKKGRLDMSVRMDHADFVFEFKVVDLVADQSPALEQIKAKGYHRKFLGQGKPVYLVGVEFNALERNVVRVEWEEL